MKDTNVEIIKLNPMKMISFYGYGQEPEDIAWEKLITWVKANNFRIDPNKNRIFGFNNPCPTAGSTNYGYEFWISVNSSLHVEDDIKLIDFSGGLYACANLSVQSGEEIPKYWKTLNIWCENSKYDFGNHQWLEEHSADGNPCTMFLPIK